MELRHTILGFSGRYDSRFRSALAGQLALFAEDILNRCKEAVELLANFLDGIVKQMRRRQAAVGITQHGTAASLLPQAP